MKKASRIVLCLMFSVMLCISVYAEEFNGADLFTMDIPDGYEQTGAATSDFNFVNEDGSSFSVAYADNAETEEIFCPKNFTEKKIAQYAQELADSSKIAMKEYAENFSMKVIDYSKQKHADETEAIVLQFETSFEHNGEMNTFYQKVYEFGGINNKYTFTYTTTQSEKINDFDSAFESIDIFEPYVRSNSEKVAVYLIAAGMAGLIVVGIIRFIRTPEKRKQGKIK